MVQSRREGADATAWRQQHSTATPATVVVVRGRAAECRGQWLAVAGLGQAKASSVDPAWRRGAQDTAMCAALGGRAHSTRQPEAVSCMNFKASIKTKLLKLKLNRLHYAKEVLLGYQPELKHDTTS